MSGESTDSESTPSDNYKRSRSLLRQVRASLTGRNLDRDTSESKRESSSVLLIRKKRRSFDTLDLGNSPLKYQRKYSSKPRTPIAFSHHLSLFDHVKLHLTGTPKYRRTVPSEWQNIDDDDADEFQSAPSIASNSVSVYLHIMLR